MVFGTKISPRFMDTPLVSRLVNDPKYFLETFVSIVDKERNTVPFIFNESQLKYYQQMSLRDIILKARQIGFSTEIMGLFLHDTMYVPNTTSIIVAQTEKDASDLFSRVRFMFESIDEEFRPKVRYSNRKELLFDKINSWYFVGSAESKGFGRGKTINNLHCSECSLPTWNKDFMDGLLESVPKTGRVIIESTARGEGGLFYDMYFDAKNKDNEFKNHFYRWFEHWEYREPIPIGITRKDYVNSYDWEELDLVKRYGLEPEQIQWRRTKKSRLRSKFVQEYPEMEDVDAFIKSGSSIFDAEMLKERDDALPEQAPAEIWLGGELFLYRIAQPGAKYIVSADTSEGDIHSDFSAAMVTRIWPLPLEQCALLHGRWSPDIFSEKVYKVARAYNYGLIAVERNNHGHAALLNLSNGIVRQGAVVLPPYPNLYVGPDKKLGWHTGPTSKPQMIDELDRVIRSGELVINSKEFIKEARRFVALKGGAMGVPPQVGHDDCVMAQAVGIVAISGGKFDYEFV